MTAHSRLLCALVLLIGLCSANGAVRGETIWPLEFPGAQYQPVDWSDLDGWADDDHAAAFATFLDSCHGLNGKRPPSVEMTEVNDALKDVCERAQAAVPVDDNGAQKFFEDNFRPVQISELGTSDGFLTGYYEPVIDGSRVPTAEFHAPLYGRPPNLVASGWRKLGDAFPSKGAKVGRRVGRRKIVPYYTRAEIEDGALSGWHLELCYLRSPIDVLFAQIQGSARIRMEDGSILRVNYDSHNGWPYTPVGRVLIDRKLMTRDQVSMQSIRQWMEANPQAADDVRRQNKSYVFFRVTDLPNEEGAIGGQGVPLVSGRSIAIDRALHVYGTPFFIDADLPLAGGKTPTKFQRLMIAQDTGSAIVGPARADIFFGAGDEAARMAGRIKNAGRFFMLLPRGLDPVEAGYDTPLPEARPSATSVAGAGSATGAANADGPADGDTSPPQTQPAADEAPAAAAAPAAAVAPKPHRRHKR